MLSLLGIYLHASPHVQRLAVRKWNIVPVLIGLLWEQPIQKLALDMVRLSLCCNTVSTIATLRLPHNCKVHSTMARLSLLHDCFYHCRSDVHLHKWQPHRR